MFPVRSASGIRSSKGIPGRGFQTRTGWRRGFYPHFREMSGRRLPCAMAPLTFGLIPPIRDPANVGDREGSKGDSG
jgi:hypothetical protein